MFKIILPIFLLGALTACTTGENLKIQPPSVEKQSEFSELSDLTKPISDPLIVGVYSFTDQTGQRAVLSRNTSEMSSAIPQGLNAILVQELKLAGEGDWYRVVERETFSDVLNERRIVAAALGAEAEQKLPNLLLPGIILTGGAVSYDRKIHEKFSGFGISSVNGNTQVQSDQVGVVLRAVSVQTGEVIESVYASKEVLSQVSSLSGLRVFNTSTLAFEVGNAINEPVSLAVRQAIASAIIELTRRGIKRGWWSTAPS